MAHLSHWLVPGAAAAVLVCAATAGAETPVEVAGGVFFEAEDFAGKPWYSDDGFATRLEEPLASGGAALIGMYKPGAVLYRLAVRAAGDYHVWLRCAVPGDTTVRIGANATSETALRAAPLAATTTMNGLAAPDAYQWRHLGTLPLQQGENTFLLGQGAQRPDCFFLTPAAGAAPGADLLAQVARAREAPKGKLLPELRHERRIAQHPRWLAADGLRPAYAHFEWDPTNTPESWAERARQAGANCLFGVGEMPAGTLDGRMKAFPFAKIDDKGFAYPEAYRPDDYSWVKAIVDAGHAEGLKVVLYDGAHRTLDPLLVAHPEWRQQEADGRPYRDGFGSWHSPYRAAYIARWVQVARDYGIDGIMVDMLFTSPRGGDYSPFTVAAFKQRFGLEPPRAEDPRDLTWQRWVDFQTWTREEVMLDVTEALHAVNSEIACIWNQTIGWVFNGREYLSTRAGQCADGLLEEMGWEVTHAAFSQRPSAWPLQSAWQSLFLHSRASYGQMWHLNGLYTQVNHEALSYSMFANGIAPGVVAGGNWEHLRRVWGHLRACEGPMAGAELLRYAALHFSEDTLDWYANARGDAARQAYLKSVFGVFQALLETHVPLTVITDDELADPEQLRRHAMVMLPNSACLSDRQADALSAYVQGGGGLVAAFETGVFDENGTRRETPVLADLLGVRQGPTAGGSNWAIQAAQTHEILNVPEVTDGGDPAQGSRERKPRIQIFWAHRDRTAQVVQTTAVAGVASVPLGGPGPGYSVLHTRLAGAGRVAFLPPDVGHAYYTYNHPITRLLIARTVRWSAAAPPPFETDAPLAVQTVGFRQGGDLIVHLVNDNSSFGRAAAPNPENFGGFRDEVLPVHDIAVRVAGGFGQARRLPAGEVLPVSRRDGWCTVTVPRLDIHTMLVFSP